jgi:hypothetical protein
MLSSPFFTPYITIYIYLYYIYFFSLQLRNKINIIDTILIDKDFEDIDFDTKTTLT